jgi:drug/metabolite transporter (DMT)-like permease
MGLNMWASGLTYAYINALVMLTQPFTVATLERFFFGSQFPRGLYPLLVWTAVGSICVIYAQSRSALGDNSDNYFRLRDYAGMLIQFVSVLFSTASRLVARGTKKHVTRHELIIAQFGFSAVVLGGAAFIWDPASWYHILHMPPTGWIYMCFLSFAVYFVGQNLNVIVIRRLSATLLTSLSSIRLVVACFTSYFILNEPIVSALQWTGIIIVLVTISLYVRVQMGADTATASTGITGDDGGSICESSGPAIPPSYPGRQSKAVEML